MASPVTAPSATPAAGRRRSGRARARAADRRRRAALPAAAGDGGAPGDGRRVVVADLRPLVGDWRRGHQKKHGEGIVMPSLAATLIRSGSAATVGDYRR